jgi:hypothetical protein
MNAAGPPLRLGNALCGRSVPTVDNLGQAPAYCSCQRREPSGRAARGSAYPRKVACRSVAGAALFAVQGHRRALKGQPYGCSFAYPRIYRIALAVSSRNVLASDHPPKRLAVTIDKMHSRARRGLVELRHGLAAGAARTPPHH